MKPRAILDSSTPRGKAITGAFMYREGIAGNAVIKLGPNEPVTQFHPDDWSALPEATRTLFDVITEEEAASYAWA